MEFFTVENLVWVLFFAILVAIVCTCVMQKILSELAKKILEKNADSEDNSVTLEQLGYKRGIKLTLTAFFAENGDYISKAIVKVKKEAKNKDSELLFAEKEPVKYYIPAENNNKRLEKHINDRISPLKLVLIIVLLAAMAFIATTVIDMLGKYASSLTENSSDKAIGVTEEQNSSLLEEQKQANKEEELAKKEQEELERIEEQAKQELEAAQKAQNGETQNMEETPQSDDIVTAD